MTLAAVDSLPSEFPASEAPPPEGDDHFDAFSGARDALRRWVCGRGRRIHVAGDLPVYYPNESMFSPDVRAEQRQRSSWIVDAEGGKGLDVAIEIVVRGDRKKDLERNVERYARLGIPEYDLFDRRRLTLAAWELEGQRYRRRVPQGGRTSSAVLGLDPWLDVRLRFSVGDAPLPCADELIDRVTRLSAQAHARVDLMEAEPAEEQRRREEEQRRREEEQRRREESEIERLRGEIERLRQEGSKEWAGVGLVARNRSATDRRCRAPLRFPPLIKRFSQCYIPRVPGRRSPITGLGSLSLRRNHVTRISQGSWPPGRSRNAGHLRLCGRHG